MVKLISSIFFKLDGSELSFLCDLRQDRFLLATEIQVKTIRVYKTTGFDTPLDGFCLTMKPCYQSLRYHGTGNLKLDLLPLYCFLKGTPNNT